MNIYIDSLSKKPGTKCPVLLGGLISARRPGWLGLAPACLARPGLPRLPRLPPPARGTCWHTSQLLHPNTSSTYILSNITRLELTRHLRERMWCVKYLPQLLQSGVRMSGHWINGHLMTSCLGFAQLFVFATLCLWPRTQSRTFFCRHRQELLSYAIVTAHKIIHNSQSQSCKVRCCVYNT